MLLAIHQRLLVIPNKYLSSNSSSSKLQYFIVIGYVEMKNECFLHFIAISFNCP